MTGTSVRAVWLQGGAWGRELLSLRLTMPSIIPKAKDRLRESFQKSSCLFVSEV